MILDDIFKTSARRIAEEVDTGEYDARKTTPSSDRDREGVFARHRERVKNIDRDEKQEKKKDVEEAIPSHIKPSDIPPAMRNRRLTMKDIESERPQGAYRFRVGEKEFMDLRAAQEFAAGTGEKVQRIREAASQKKSSNPRIERILKQLRARHPQAQDDLEALIYDFRSEQAQDDRDIARLDMENDTEEADIERLEKILANLKQQRALAEKRDHSPGKITKSEDPCWSGYHMVGTKKKNGREVPNCVPGAKGATNEAASGYAISVRRSGPNETPVKA